jgi:hypothetical protein
MGSHSTLTFHVFYTWSNCSVTNGLTMAPYRAETSSQPWPHINIIYVLCLTDSASLLLLQHTTGWTLSSNVEHLPLSVWRISTVCTLNWLGNDLLCLLVMQIWGCSKHLLRKCVFVPELFFINLCVFLYHFYVKVSVVTKDKYKVVLVLYSCKWREESRTF